MTCWQFPTPAPRLLKNPRSYKLLKDGVGDAAGISELTVSIYHDVRQHKPSLRSREAEGNQHLAEPRSRLLTHTEHFKTRSTRRCDIQNILAADKASCS